MEYDSFIEIENNEGLYEHYYFSTKERKIGRKLNINEDYFLRMAYKSGYYDFNFINRIFEIMKDADDSRWLRVLSGANIFINEAKL